MNQLKIKRIKAQNFLCYGPEGIDINFEKMGNIISIRGKNLDIPDENEEEQIASNGVGKSAISESIVYGLTGKTIRKLNVDRVINNQSGNKLRVELFIDNLRIVRRRNPTDFRVWETINDEEVEKTKGGSADTQEWIDSKLGMGAGGYESLINLLVLTDNNSGSFLESDGPTKRKMVENYLGLEQYVAYSKTAGELFKQVKGKIKEISKDYENIERAEEESKRRITENQQQETNWKKTKQSELNALVVRYKAKQAELTTTDTGAALARYEEAQNGIASKKQMIADKESQLDETKNTLTDKESQLTEIKDALEKNSVKLNDEKTKRDKFSINIQQFKMNLVKAKNTLAEHNSIIENVEKQKCIKCNYYDEDIVKRSQSIIDAETKNILEFETLLEKENSQFNKCGDIVLEISQLVVDSNTRLKKASTEIDGLRHKVDGFRKEIDGFRKEIDILSKIDKPEISLNEKILEEQLNELRNQTLTKKAEVDGPSPFVQIIQNSIEESEKKSAYRELKKTELNEANKLLPYYEFWVKAFGEDGIRKFIIDGVIPALNDRVAYWLNYLIDNKITLCFDNNLNEKIERNPIDGDDFVYWAMSGGERRRLNLAVSQAFSHIMMLTTGTCPSLIFLDEVTTNIDPIGVQGVYNMIVELAKERQVLVTTHDQGLLELLDNFETINLEKKGGITRIV